MNYPHVQFLLNKELDTWTAKEFSVGTNEDVSHFYSLHTDALDAHAKKVHTNWEAVAPQFFEITTTLFKNHPWPEGKYIGYISMFDCNPRFLQDCTFQVYYKHKAGSNYVTAHELLHFIFYDYALKNHEALFKNKNTESGIFWDIAEVFNSVLLHSTTFSALFPTQEEILYPTHSKWVPHLRVIWDKNQNVDTFIKEAYQYILDNPV